MQNLIDRVDEVEMALWFHDAIYDPRAADNEERSAMWLQNVFTARESCLELANYIVKLILVTSHHRPTSDINEQMVVDIDLSILGAKPEKFDRYDWQIRQEYNWLDEDTYRQGRMRVLENFLARDSIFHSLEFQQRYEEIARTNICRAINRLQERGVG